MTPEIKKGLVFYSKYYHGKTTVLKVDESKNEIIVEIDGEYAKREEDRNLQQTIWGFERGEYVLNSTPDYLRNIRLANQRIETLQNAKRGNDK